jgi:hypothetical protein
MAADEGEGQAGATVDTEKEGPAVAPVEAPAAVEPVAVVEEGPHYVPFDQCPVV